MPSPPTSRVGLLSRPPLKVIHVLFKLSNDKPYASDVDIQRMARKIKRDGLAPTTDQALELAAHLLGERSYHSLLQSAKSGNMASWSFHDITPLIQEIAVTKGVEFPRRMQPRFDATWKSKVSSMLQDAVDAFTPTALSFIALVGAAGSGKTIAADDFVARKGGLVVDMGLLPAPMFSMEVGHGQVLCFDRPAVNPVHNAHIFERLSRLQASGRCTLPEVMAVWREPSVGIPLDSLSMMGDSQARKLAARAPLIIAFASEEHVQQSIDGAHTLQNLKGELKAGRNWTSVRVVNLDTLTATTLFGPGQSAI